MAVGHLAHKVVENHVRRFINRGGARFPPIDAVMTLGGRDAFAAVGKLHVALQVEPAGGGVGVTFDHHRAFTLRAKIEVNIAVNVLFVHVLKAHDALSGTAHDTRVVGRQQPPGLNAAAAINTRTQRAKNGRGASLITASGSSKSSYRNS